METKERLSSPELEQRPNIGVGLLIVNRQGKIWTNVELMPKQDTARNPGEISIPTEQVKVGEGFYDNIRGGLGEFCSDKDMQLLRRSLYLVGLPKIVKVNSDTWQVACNLVTIVCDVNINPTPAATNEVRPNGWVTIEDALNISNLRPFSRQLLEVAKRNNLGGRALNQNSRRFPILSGFSNGISFNGFIRKRDRSPDKFNSKSI